MTSKKYLELQEEEKTAEQAFKEAQEKEVSSHTDIEQKEMKLQELKLQVSEKEIRVNELQTIHQKRREDVRTKEDEIRELKFEIEQARRNKEVTSSIVEQYKTRQEALTTDKNRLNEKIVAVRLESEKLLSEFEEKNTRYQNLSERIERADEELTERRRDMLAVSSSHSHLEAKKSGLEAQLEQMEVQWALASEVADELRVKQTEFISYRKKVSHQREGQRQLQLSLMKDVANFEENVRMIFEQMESQREEVQDFKDQLNALTSRLYGLENLQDNFEGFQEGVKKIMLWQRQKAEQTTDGSISFHPLSEVIEVSEEYELVMEAVLGSRLQVLLSEDQEEALQAVDYLKEQKGGAFEFSI